MPFTNANARRLAGQNGFTLVELMMAAFVSLIVFAALFSAYIFIARNTTRISLAQQQTLQSSRLLHQFANDIGSATKVLAGTSNWQLVLQLPTSTVTYSYTNISPTQGTLQRTDSVAGTTLTLNGIVPLPFQVSSPYSSNIFNYYAPSGANLLPPPNYSPPLVTPVADYVDIKQLELTYLSIVGVASNGTEVQNITVSPRMIMRNKPPFGQ